MKKAYFLFLLCFGFGISFAQTKLISHKSHSGSTANFKLALDKNLFDLGDSNFGVAPEPFIRTARLDSLIFISPEKAVMVTTNTCVQSYVDTTIWSAGKDTVYNHPLFNQQHSLNEIKKILDQEYNFDNKAKSVTFIGYDNKSVKEDKPKQVKEDQSKEVKEKVKKKEKKLKKKKVKKKKNKALKKKKEVQPEESPSPESTDQIDYSKSGASFLSIGLLALFSFLIAYFASLFQKP